MANEGCSNVRVNVRKSGEIIATGWIGYSRAEFLHRKKNCNPRYDVAVYDHERLEGRSIGMFEFGMLELAD